MSGSRCTRPSWSSRSRKASWLADKPVRAGHARAAGPLPVPARRKSRRRSRHRRCPRAPFAGQAEADPELRCSSRSASCRGRTRRCPGRHCRWPIAADRGCAGWRPRHRRAAAWRRAHWCECALEHQRHHQARRGHADGAGQQMLGETEQADVGFVAGLGHRGRGPGSSRRRRARCARRRDSAPPSLRASPTVTAVRHRRKPAAAGLEFMGHESSRPGPARSGSAGASAKSRYRPATLTIRLHITPWVSGIEFQVEQHARPQHADAERAVSMKPRADPAGIGEGRQQQACRPRRRSRREARHGAPRGARAARSARRRRRARIARPPRKR